MADTEDELVANARKWLGKPRADLAAVADVLISQLIDRIIQLTKERDGALRARAEWVKSTQMLSKALDEEREACAKTAELHGFGAKGTATSRAIAKAIRLRSTESR